MTLQFAVVYEAPGDFQIATELADRVLCESIDWLEREHLDQQREWIDQNPDGRPLTWSGMKKLAYEAGIEAQGHFGGQPGAADASAARRALNYLRKIMPRLDGIVLVRDQDDQPERNKGLNQAREAHHGTLAIVIGLAIPEREAWVLCGFEPANEAERKCLADERQQLGHDPRLGSERLTACKNNSALRSAKRVLNVFTGSNTEREQECWRNAPLQDLSERGQKNGLASYLNDVKTVLAPLIGYLPRT